jgi:Major capsid protein 13-like
MPTSSSGLTFYDETFSTGEYEGLAQRVDGFNEASGNAIRINRVAQRGRKTSANFFTHHQAVVRRDPTSSGTVTPSRFTNTTHVRIKVYRNYTTDWALQDFNDLGLNTETGQRLAGIEFGQQKYQDYLNTALSAGLGALLATGSSITTDITGASTTTLNHPDLNVGYSKLGDNSFAIRSVFMHSKPWHDLIGDAIVNQSFAAGQLAIYEGTTRTGGRIPIVTDAAPLIVTAPTPDQYYLMGLTENAILIEESEEEQRWLGIVPGDHNTAPENILVRFIAQYAFTLNLKGVSYTGTDNPDASTLATSGNWALRVSNAKQGLGVLMKTE